MTAGDEEKRACDVTDRLVAIETGAGRVAVESPSEADLGFRGCRERWSILALVSSFLPCPTRSALTRALLSFFVSLFSPFRSFLPTSDQHRTVCPPLAPSLFSPSPQSPTTPTLSPLSTTNSYRHYSYHPQWNSFSHQLAILQIYVCPPSLSHRPPISTSLDPQAIPLGSFT